MESLFNSILFFTFAQSRKSEKRVFYVYFYFMNLLYFHLGLFLYYSEILLFNIQTIFWKTTLRKEQIRNHSSPGH